MPKKPLHIDEQLKVFSKMKLPHFFKFAKDKTDTQIDELNNSTVNKLYNLVPNKPIQFKKVSGKFDYKMLMNNKKVVENEEIIETFVKINRAKRFLINESDKSDQAFNKYLTTELRKLSRSESYISDVLVSYFFRKNSANKETLWKCYGYIIYNNILKNLGNTFCCEMCNERFEKNKSKQIFCEACSIENNRIKTRERQALKRKRKE